MGQYWDFYNVDKREIGERNGLAKLGEFFFSKQGFLVRSITLPHSRHATPTVANVAQSTGLFSLPNELLLKITGSFTSLQTLAAFAVTCRRVFDLARYTVEDARDGCAAPWACCRVVCLGDYASYEDVPKSLYTAQERAEIEGKRDSAGTDKADMSYGGIHQLKVEPHNLWRGAHAFYDPKRWPDEINEWYARFTKADRKRFDALMAVTYPTDRKDWVLCNLSKKEYVRASEIAKLAKRPNDAQPFLPNCLPDLGQALLTRIAWSEDDSISMAKNEVTAKLHRGAWVGDNICITTLERILSGSEEDEEWMDISTSVIRDLIYIYRAEFGKKWLKVIKDSLTENEQYEWYWMASDGDDDTAMLGRATGMRPPRRWFWSNF
ncbi:hypothetical protein BD311DRAFT_848308 [Dichomitus squalens]|uniref:F-box domain-containing protein n=1 Tax=Dichomitus squalens TaxID=114155 RepID=A0A4Q9N3L1_9APHY|nr:hypothetical protein BD311DRAFT_848308 [Dichomitus squalens]